MLTLMLRSVICFELIFVCDVRGHIHFFVFAHVVVPALFVVKTVFSVELS